MFQNIKQKLKTENTCNVLQGNLENGYVECSNGNEINSECSCTCNDGYHFKSDMLDKFKRIATTCNHNGVWSRSVPICIKIKCGFREQHIEEVIAS